MSKVFNKVTDFQNYREQISSTVGFVPTMGALHEGHLSLLKKSKEENEVTILSIFINPTQFNNPEDLKKYPRAIQQDIELAESVGVDAILIPEYNEIYSDHYRFKVTENEFSKILCGAHRPGHFDGVLTVVLKLLNITTCHKAYFGKKDYQQFKLIEDMAKTLFLNTKIVGCETLRENDGLAMSSRNVRLTAEGRQKAPEIYKALSTSKTLQDCRQYLTNLNFEIEYLEEHFNRRFIATFVDGVRLIDNVEIK